MKTFAYDIAWLAAVAVTGLAFILIDVRIGFPALLALVIGSPS